MKRLLVPLAVLVYALMWWALTEFVRADLPLPPDPCPLDSHSHERWNP